MIWTRVTKPLSSYERLASRMAILIVFMLFAAEIQVFNIHGDEGIGRAELTTMLSAIQQSTNTILSSVSDSDDAVMYGENREQAVKRMVDAAFKNCDITRTGKLLPLVSGNTR